MTHLPSEPGTYLLFIPLAAPLTLQAGRLGSVELCEGLYVYVGSAHGPGGLRARVGRHLRADKPQHWHIDALTARAPVAVVWYTAAPERLECTWAGLIAAVPGVSLPMISFGASDCTCPAHLFALPESAVRTLYAALDQPCRITLVT